ncbi:uncharacterized [Tachysurus ichikawai]
MLYNPSGARGEPAPATAFSAAKSSFCPWPAVAACLTSGQENQVHSGSPLFYIIDVIDSPSTSASIFPQGIDQKKSQPRSKDEINGSQLSWNSAARGRFKHIQHISKKVIKANLGQLVVVMKVSRNTIFNSVGAQYTGEREKP